VSADEYIAITSWCRWQLAMVIVGNCVNPSAHIGIEDITLVGPGFILGRQLIAVSKAPRAIVAVFVVPIGRYLAVTVIELHMSLPVLIIAMLVVVVLIVLILAVIILIPPKVPRRQCSGGKSEKEQGAAINRRTFTCILRFMERLLKDAGARFPCGYLVLEGGVRQHRPQLLPKR
jgi:hypothetical protein